MAQHALTEHQTLSTMKRVQMQIGSLFFFRVELGVVAQLLMKIQLQIAFGDRNPTWDQVLINTYQSN